MGRNADLNRLGRGGCLVLGLLLLLVISMIGSGAAIADTTSGWVIYGLVSLFFIPMAWLRLKDAGQNPWWAVGIVVPIVSLAVALWCICAPSAAQTEAIRHRVSQAKNIRFSLCGRVAYWLCSALMAALLVVLVAAFQGLFPAEHTQWIGILLVILFWAGFVAFVPLTWLRLKDAGIDGRWAFAWLIPGIGFIPFAIGLFTPSKSEMKVPSPTEERDSEVHLSSTFPSNKRLWVGSSDTFQESTALPEKVEPADSVFAGMGKIVVVGGAVIGVLWLGVASMCSTIPNPKTDPAYASAVTEVESLASILKLTYRVNFRVEKLETSEIMLLAKRWQMARRDGHTEKFLLEIAEKYRSRMGEVR